MKKIVLMLMLAGIPMHTATGKSHKTVHYIKKAVKVTRHLLTLSSSAIVTAWWSHHVYHTHQIYKQNWKKTLHSMNWYGTPMIASYGLAGYGIYRGLKGLNKELKVYKRLKKALKKRL